MTTRAGKSPAAAPRWHTVDADGKVLGRLATQVATILRGKHRPDFAPYREGGDHVIVTNAARVRLTGRKLEQKFHSYHTGYPGGLKQIRYAELLRDHPERVVQYAVWGMLPKNKLGQKLRKHLRVYAGPEHPHVAQQPKALEQGDSARRKRGEGATQLRLEETQEGGVNG